MAFSFVISWVAEQTYDTPLCATFSSVSFTALRSSLYASFVSSESLRRRLTSVAGFGVKTSKEIVFFAVALLNELLHFMVKLSYILKETAAYIEKRHAWAVTLHKRLLHVYKHHIFSLVLSLCLSVLLIHCCHQHH